MKKLFVSLLPTNTNEESPSNPKESYKTKFKEKQATSQCCLQHRFKLTFVARDLSRCIPANALAMYDDPTKNQVFNLFFVS